MLFTELHYGYDYCASISPYLKINFLSKQSLGDPAVCGCAVVIVNIDTTKLR